MTFYRSRPEARFVEYFADTGRFDSSKIHLFGAEAAMVKGPLWMQTELIYSSVDTNTYGTLGFKGTYFQAGYFLTGEVRPYNRKEGIFRGVVPGVKFEGGVPFRKSNGGALEVTGRISTIDLNDKELRGGAVTDLSFGFNWHASATQKVMLNYIRSKPEDVGIANIFLLRYQYRPLDR